MASLQATINAAAGGTAVLNADYYVTSAITIPDNTTVIRQGGIIYADSLSAVFTPDDSTGVSLIGLKINGTDTCDRAILFGEGSAYNFNVINCEIYNFLAAAFRPALDLYGGKFVNNYVHDVVGDAGVVVGVSASYLHNFDISWNIFEDIGEKDGDWAVYGSSVGTNVRIHHNTISNCFGGIKMYPGSGTMEDLLIYRNTISTNDHEGMSLGQLNNPTVRDNTVTAPNMGIRLESVHGAKISGGSITVTSGGEHGIFANDDVEDLTVTDIDFTGPGSGTCNALSLRECIGLTATDIRITGFLNAVGQWEGAHAQIQNVTLSDLDMVGIGSGVFINFVYADGISLSDSVVEDVQFFIDLDGNTSTPYVITDVLIEDNTVNPACSSWGRVHSTQGTIQNNTANGTAMSNNTWYSLSTNNATLTNNLVV